MLSRTPPLKFLNSNVFNKSKEQASKERWTPASKPFEKLKRACKGALFGVAQISVVTNLLMLTGPLFMLQIYDRVLSSQSVPTLVGLFLIVVVLFAFLGILEVIRARVLSRVGTRIDAVLRNQVYDAMVSVAPAADTARRQMLSDLDKIRHFMSGQGPVAAFDLPWTPLYFAVIFLLHWVLGVVALVAAACLIALSLLNERLSRKPTIEAMSQTAHSQALAASAAQDAEAMSTMGLKEGYRERFLSAHEQAVSKHGDASDVSSLFSVSGRITRLFLQSAILAVGAYLAILQEITPGAIIAASIILSRGLAPIEQAIGHWRGFLAARDGLSRIRKTVQMKSTQEPRTRLPAAKGHLVLDKVFACPPGETDPLLKSFSIDVTPGSILAVIGPSAAGKSTLAKVITGAWHPLRGSVRLDGAELQHWPEDQRAKAVGYLPQDIHFYDGNVAQNIARFRQQDPVDVLMEAVQQSEVHEIVVTLPDAYETKLGPHGRTLSGGQRQRIALARAIYGNPALIVMDEPNANLDRNGEAALARVIKRLKERGTTVIIMAHRRAIVEEATHLLVMKEGRVAAFGRKDEIIDMERHRQKKSREAVIS